MQAVKLLVSKPDEIVQRQPLGELTELVAGAGADQRVQITPVIRLARGLFNLLHQRQLVLPVIAVLLKLLTDLALMRGVLAQLLRQLLQLALQRGGIGIEPFRPQRQMRLQLLVSLPAQRRGLLDLVFQRLFQLFKVANSIVIQQGGKKRVLVGKAARRARRGELRLRLLQALSLQPFLLLLRGQLALQRHALVVDGAPVIRNNRFGVFAVRCRKRVEQRFQGVYAFLKHAVLRLLLLPLREFRFAGLKPGGFLTLFRCVK